MNKLKLTSLLLASFFFLAANLQAQCTAEHKALLAKMDMSMEKKDPEMLKEIYHADAVRYTQEGPEEGIEALMEGAKRFYESVPDAKGTTEDVICSGSKIVTRWTGNGTHKPSGKALSVTGITIIEMKDGKIAKEWEEMNMMALMMQMGATITPPPGMGND